MSEILAAGSQALLPLISLVSGILSLYVDPQKDPKKKWLLVSVLVLSALATVGMSVRDDKSHKKEADALHEALASTKSELQTVQTVSQSTHSDVSVLLNCIAQKFGYSSESIRTLFADGSLINQLTVSAAADRQREKLIASKLPTEGPSPTVIYYAKADEATGIVKALKEVGSLKVVVRQPLDPNPSNVIWIGDGISPKEAQYVAQTLLRAGVRLNKILRFYDGAGSKSTLIEVGAYEDFRSSAPLTSDDIATMSDFPRDPKPPRNRAQ
ncbi:MAG TPA: hypothetical protein VN025_17650 [Candidatus Dormibacteraeota bacterium]|nr:hypothetical protein [Candidatus Dormibacteraeota bacterium]